MASQETNPQHVVIQKDTAGGKDAFRCSCGSVTHRMDWMSDENWKRVREKFFRHHNFPKDEIIDYPMKRMYRTLWYGGLVCKVDGRFIFIERPDPPPLGLMGLVVGSELPPTLPLQALDWYVRG